MIGKILMIEKEQGTIKAIENMEKLMMDHNEEFEGHLQFYLKRNKKIKILDIIRNGIPEFKVVDWNGKPFTINDYKGKVLIIDFWATWCIPCVEEIPHLVELYKKYHDDGLEIMGISYDYKERKTPEELRKFCKNQDMQWDQIYSGKGMKDPLGEKLNIKSLPTILVVDRTGKVHLGKRGNDLVSQIDSLI